MMKKYIMPVMIGLAALLVVAGVYAAKFHLLVKPPVATLPEKSAKKPAYSDAEIAAFNDMISISHKMDSLENYTLRGTMVAHDPSDAAGQLNTTFLFCRRGHEFYYQVGDEEMVALRDVYIDINKVLKKMTVSAARQIETPHLMRNDSLSRIWQEESYAITRDSTIGVVTIRLLCEQHASCKEYRVSYDPQTRLMKNTYMRLTDLSDPFNKAKDKIVQITANSWELKATPLLLDRFQYLSGQPGHWSPARHYTGYVMSNY